MHNGLSDDDDDAVFVLGCFCLVAKPLPSFVSRPEWHWRMTPVQLQCKTGKLQQQIRPLCLKTFLFYSTYVVVWLNSTSFCVLRFFPPAYSIANRMIAQTTLSPYMSPVSTYQVWVPPFHDSSEACEARLLTTWILLSVFFKLVLAAELLLYCCLELLDCWSVLF